MALVRRLVCTVVLISGAALVASSCESEPQTDGDADGDADLDGSHDADRPLADSGGSDADNPCLPDPDGGDAGGGDADGDADGGDDGDIHTDADSLDADAPRDSDLDRDLRPCPADMVDAGDVCIDRYEASRSDATAALQGSATDVARSVDGVMPWSENPVDDVVLATYSAACATAGKRLCTPDEWEDACQGPLDHIYVFGDTFDREACNCVDTWCDDYCATHPEVDPCSEGDNCGYVHGCMAIYPTGSMPGCTNGLGTFDINGNVWEIVAPSTTDGRGYEVRGGAFNCASAAARLRCDFNASWTTLHAGFRCCMDR